MLENKLFEGIYYSVFVISWVNKRGIVDYRFKNWLDSLIINGKNIPDDIKKEIYDFGTTGKFELELSAKNFNTDVLMSRQDLLKAKKAELIGGDW